MANKNEVKVDGRNIVLVQGFIATVFDDMIKTCAKDSEQKKAVVAAQVAALVALAEGGLRALFDEGDEAAQERERFVAWVKANFVKVPGQASGPEVNQFGARAAA